jgi:DNA ligase-1
MPHVSPLLASQADDFSLLRFPLCASPKLDGVRALVRDGVVWSRSGKPIPNARVQRLFGPLHGWDGELVCGDPLAPDCFRKTQSAVMRKEGEPDVTFFQFDDWTRESPFFRFYADRRAREKNAGLPAHTALVAQHMVYGQRELEEYERECLELGFEGVMLRDPDAGYKFGRSTAREGILLKVKRFADAEAVPLDMEEQVSETGEPKNTLGALVVRDLKTGVVFSIASGFTQADRDAFWRRGLGGGELVRYRHFPTGGKDKPRFPVFAGLRSRADMEAAHV